MSFHWFHTCRLCMYVSEGEEEGSKMVQIFAEPKLAATITYVTDLVVGVGDGLPSVICHRCNIRVKSAESFKKLSHTSDQRLRQQLLSDDSWTSEPVYCVEVDHQSGNLIENPPSNEENVVESLNQSKTEEQDLSERQADDEEHSQSVQIKEEVKSADEILDMFTESGAPCYLKIEIEDVTESANESENNYLEDDYVEDYVEDIVKFKYRCDTCGKHMKTPQNLRQHMKHIHMNIRPHKCDTCGRCFHTRTHLKRHSLRHSKVKVKRTRQPKNPGSPKPPIPCPVCNRMFANAANLAGHRKNAHSDGHHECPKCDLVFTKYSQLKRHRPIHLTNTGRHKCKLCGLGFELTVSLYSHMKSHEQRNDDELRCEICNRVCTTRGNLATHRMKHSEERPFSCNVCQATFKTKQYLKEHSTIHTDIKPFLCSTCGKSFRTKKILQRHLMIHSGEQPSVPCPLCLKLFSHKSAVRTHVNHFHKGQRKYVCDLCGKKLVTASVLARHKLTHTGERPHVCTVCGKGFGRPEHLATHMLLHTGERNYQCEDCLKTFVYKVALVNHYKKSCRRRS